MREIATIEELDRLLGDSDGVPLFLYKHSTACPVSHGTLESIETFLNGPLPEHCPDFLMVKVIESRPVSLAIADRMGVPHQSPQLILVRGGRAKWDVSHFHITPEAITQAITEHVG